MSPSTKEVSCAAQAASKLKEITTRAAAVKTGTIHTTSFVVTTESAASLTADILIAADLMSMKLAPTAAVTDAPMTILTMSVAVGR